VIFKVFHINTTPALVGQWAPFCAPVMFLCSCIVVKVCHHGWEWTGA